MDVKTGLISLTAASVLAVTTAIAADDIKKPAEPQDQSAVSTGPDLNPPAEASTRELPPEDLGEDEEQTAAAEADAEAEADMAAEDEDSDELLGENEDAGDEEQTAVLEGDAEDELDQQAEGDTADIKEPAEPQDQTAVSTGPDLNPPAEAATRELPPEDLGEDEEQTAAAEADAEADLDEEAVGGGTSAGAGTEAEADMAVEDDESDELLGENDAADEEETAVIEENVEDDLDQQAQADADEIKEPAEPQDQTAVSTGPDLNPPAEAATRELPPEDLGDDERG